MQSQKNSKGFPVGPFAEDSNEEDLLRWCMRCLIRFLILCDAFHDDDLNASPYGVLILVMINCVVYEATCPITGLALNWSFPPWHPLSPKVIAHAQHGRTGCFGLKPPCPSSVKDWDPTAVSVRVESRAANFFIASHRYSTLTRFLEESVEDANDVLLVLRRQGILGSRIDLSSFAPDDQFRHLLRLNALAPFEADLYFSKWRGPKPWRGRRHGCHAPSPRARRHKTRQARAVLHRRREDS